MTSAISKELEFLAGHGFDVKLTPMIAYAQITYAQLSMISGELTSL